MTDRTTNRTTILNKEWSTLQQRNQIYTSSVILLIRLFSCLYFHIVCFWVIPTVMKKESSCIPFFFFFFLSNPPNPGYGVTQTQRFSLHKLYARLVRMWNTECLSSLSRARLLQSHNQSGSEGRIQPELYSSIHYMDNSCQQRRE